MKPIELVGGFAHADKDGQITIPPKETVKIKSVNKNYLEIDLKDERGRNTETEGR